MTPATRQVDVSTAANGSPLGQARDAGKLNGVHEDDVGHDDEGREPGQHVAPERGVPLLELEETLETVPPEPG